MCEVHVLQTNIAVNIQTHYNTFLHISKEEIRTCMRHIGQCGMPAAKSAVCHCTAFLESRVHC